MGQVHHSRVGILFAQTTKRSPHADTVTVRVMRKLDPWCWLPGRGHSTVATPPEYHRAAPLAAPPPDQMRGSATGLTSWLRQVHLEAIRHTLHPRPPASTPDQHRRLHRSRNLAQQVQCLLVTDA